jgi:hypothetical protein
MGSNHFLFEVDGDDLVVGFDHDILADQVRRNSVGVGVKTNTEVGVDFGHFHITAVGKDPWQRHHGIGLKSLDGFFSGGVV